MFLVFEIELNEWVIVWVYTRNIWGDLSLYAKKLVISIQRETFSWDLLLRVTVYSTQQPPLLLLSHTPECPYYGRILRCSFSPAFFFIRILDIYNLCGAGNFLLREISSKVRLVGLYWQEIKMFTWIAKCF